MLFPKAMNNALICLIMLSDARKKGTDDTIKNSVLDNVNTPVPQNKTTKHRRGRVSPPEFL